MNFLDKSISIFSPKWALQREVARMNLDFVRKYEGSSKTRFNSGWLSTGESNNQDILKSVVALRARSLDLIKNNSYAKRGTGLIVNTAVGTGIKIEFEDDALNEQWKLFSESYECDFDEDANVYGIQYMALKTAIEQGDCILRKRIRKPDTINPFSIEIQVLPPEFLAVEKTEGLSNGNYIVGGVEYSKEGKKVAYYLWQKNPMDGDRNNKQVRIDAKDASLVFRKDFLGQARGVPELSNAMVKIKQLGEYEHAQLIKQRNSACYSEYIVSEREDDIPLDEGAETEAIEPGMRKRLRPGEDIRTANPPSVDGYSEHVTQNLYAISSSLGVPYCLLTGDFTKMNYSSFRGAWLTFHKDIDVLRAYTIYPRICYPIVRWFLEDMDVRGKKVRNPKHSYTPPRRELIDPTKEIPSLVLALRAGIETLGEVHKSMGKSPDEVLKEIQKYNQFLDEMEIVLDSDPRKTSKNGNLQNLSEETTEDEGEE